MAERKSNETTYETGVTHGGRFHADDVLSTALLRSLFPKLKVIRMVKYEASAVPQRAIVYDIGGGKYDHHTKRENNVYGVPYSAFGLLWREFGERYLKSKGFFRLQEAKTFFEEKYVSKVDQGDNCGYSLVVGFPENELIVSFNPLWYEEERSDERFEQAVAFGRELLELWTRKAYQTVEMSIAEDAIWARAKARATDGIFVFDEGLPWKRVAKRHVEDCLRVAIGKSNRSGYYVMPAEGSGLVVPEDPRLSFRHPSGYLGIAEKEETARLIAKRIVSEENG